MPVKTRARHDVPMIEWITGAVASAIVLGMLAFIGYEAVFGDGAPPALRVTVAGTRSSPGGFAAEVTVANESSQAAANVLVEGVVRGADGTEIRSDATVDHVPGFSSRRATLLFPGPYANEAVRVRVRGFTAP